MTRPAVKGLDELLSCLPAELAAEVLYDEAIGDCAGITCDSREAGPGKLFVAIRGALADGHNFIPQAVAQGSSCLVVEEDPGPLPGVTVVRVTNSAEALGWLAAAFYDFPARSLTLIGLTGTNGKTTVSWMLEQMLSNAGLQVGVIGTVNYRYQESSGKEVVEPAPLTTPGQVQLQQLLRQMADQGVTHVIMETSSHALFLGRLAGLLFDVAVFTNLSRDHLDFHGNMEEYFAAKKLLFNRYLKREGQAVIVTEPSGREGKNWGERLCKELLGQQGLGVVLACGFKPEAAINADKLSQDMNGFSCELSLTGLTGERVAYHSHLTGKYNVLNLLAAVGVGRTLGLNAQQIVSGLEQVGQVPGRLERVHLSGLSADEQPCVLVDYAHTPDALRNVLQTLRSLAEGRLICLFGCGGDRDRGKRPLMGAVAAEFADLSLVTSDNPRSEEPAALLQEVAQGVCSVGAIERSVEELLGEQAVQDGDFPSFVCIEDRKDAVHAACVLAGPGDIVLLAGKGHEDYQIIGDKRHFFDDRLEALNALLRWTVPHLRKALEGSRVLQQGQQRRLLGQVSTDTRTLSPGDIFVALAGENFDGHDYLHTAVEAGAALVIVQHEAKAGELPEHIVVLQVEDTLKALGDLAAYRRRLLYGDLPLIAITGSCGKTTVKEMTAAIFHRHYTVVEGTPPGVDSVLKTKGNLNNLIGLPLSLLPVTACHKIAIMEMGMNQFGEIERLTAIADPDIACITNVQAAHLEGLGSIAGVAQAKGELFVGMRPDTVAVVNYDDPHVRRLPKRSEKIIGFACTPAGRRQRPVVRATRIQDLGAEGMRFTLHIGAWQERINVRAPGMHSVSNCLAAAAMAYAGGVAPETIVAALSGFQSTDKRMEMMILPGGVRVCNDCYNANPGSMVASLRTVSGFGQDCRHIALLGDMLELGAEAETAHAEVGRQAAELGYDQLAVIGNFAGQVAQGAQQAGMAEERVHVFGDTHTMADWLYQEMIQAGVRADDWLLLKGSRGMRMETVLQEIEQRFATGINEKEYR
ncbi:MAG: UDP-N-acetylmuramoyl-L-alanyl-D-glutamate--2,6-diaminopimelate ligase [Candidatus Electrothrix sp. GW3-4]|uniref:UDP-N-acetylmuramoyl-L-alanyl-D-glutamate--2, 6-diaminopimelate ligase n=1 Tax=Candidatus Electrothrix sp. GW3-4 TaxID=3126740 RepID=UPI0030D1E5E2